jgi:hypothetical protein
MCSIRVLGEAAPTSMAFSLMYSLKARSFKERNQNNVQQNINAESERQFLNIFVNLSLQSSLKKNGVSASLFCGWSAE